MTKEIDTSDIPETDAEFWKDAKVRMPMTAAQTILKMIEEVDPGDAGGLSKIDDLVDEYRWQGAFMRPANFSSLHKYTRSRDALKAIRPEGWRLRLAQETLVGVSWMCKICNKRDIEFMTIRATEELAELHAIVQALEYERIK